jgi:hypothetical protein
MGREPRHHRPLVGWSACGADRPAADQCVLDDLVPASRRDAPPAHWSDWTASGTTAPLCCAPAGVGGADQRSRCLAGRELNARAARRGRERRPVALPTDLIGLSSTAPCRRRGGRNPGRDTRACSESGRVMVRSRILAAAWRRADDSWCALGRGGSRRGGSCCSDAVLAADLPETTRLAETLGGQVLGHAGGVAAARFPAGRSPRTTSWSCESI